MADEQPYEPLTPAQAERRIREVSRRLLAIGEPEGELDLALRALAEAQADYDQAFLTAHLRSLDEFPDRTVGHHKSLTDAAAADEKRALLFAKAAQRTLAAEAHSLRQILSSLQTNARVMGHLSGSGR